MKKNVAAWDRGLRYIFGILLLAYALAGGPFWAYGGIYLIATAAWGMSPIYWFMKQKKS